MSTISPQREGDTCEREGEKGDQLARIEQGIIETGGQKNNVPTPPGPHAHVSLPTPSEIPRENTPPNHRSPFKIDNTSPANPHRDKAALAPGGPQKREPQPANHPKKRMYARERKLGPAAGPTSPQ
ncbi:hypothetical protein ACLOJK_000595 [Asimina triloba]